MTRTTLVLTLSGALLLTACVSMLGFPYTQWDPPIGAAQPGEIAEREACDHYTRTKRAFYGDLLGCREGRSSDRWVDFDFYGHQLVCHQVPDDMPSEDPDSSNPVDGQKVPVPHFGVILPKAQWTRLGERIRERGVPFIIEPKIRFEGEAGEQGTFFLADPDGHALEFKTFASHEQIFETEK